MRAFGEGALSHPLLVEAIESAFVPVFVSNNEPGPDRAVLESFGEPTWNNPAVRFLGPDGEPLAPRLYGDWTAAALAEHLVTALGAGAPDWLRLVAFEERGRATAAGATPVRGALRPSPTDDDHALRGTVWWTVPMTEAQRARVDAAVAAGEAPDRWLSPRQLALARRPPPR